jgi:hypothetical protein
MISTSGFAGLLILGLILLLAGTLGFFLSDPFSDPTLWVALAVFGGLLIIGAIIYLVAMQAKVRR